MINHIFQLVSPKVFAIKYKNIDLNKKVVVRPRFMSICHADQRYYRGKRSPEILQKKLPMALIHECCGTVVCDPSGKFKVGESVVIVPNQLTKKKETKYENYSKNAIFASSGKDGFMQEFLEVSAENLVSFKNIKPYTAAICEFISVGMHAVNRFLNKADIEKKDIAIWGDGNLAYVLACILKYKLPHCNLNIIGKDTRKLSYFSFANKIYLAGNLPKNFKCDHAFECAGGEGSYFAINEIINCINPEGFAFLLGVSENKVAVNTRDILEKGLTLVGCSRSGRNDFEESIKFLSEQDNEKRIEAIITKVEPVCTINDIHRVFTQDLEILFKTVFEWKL